MWRVPATPLWNCTSSSRMQPRAERETRRGGLPANIAKLPELLKR